MDLARTARILGGMAVVGAGAAMMVLPGPGILTVVAGLMVLERDVPVARRALTAIRERFGHVRFGNRRVADVLEPSVVRATRSTDG
jgi:hypothetical protein